MNTIIRSLRFACLIMLSMACAFSADLWWEGEDASKHNFDMQSFAAKDYGARAEGLSGSNWLCSGSKVPAGGRFAQYELSIPASGEYHFWTRKFWKHGPFEWRFGKQDWQLCGRDIGLADSYELATHINANWVYLGKVKLKKGKQLFELKLTAKPGESTPACLDCFYLTQGVFQPRGKLKPGQRSGKAEDGWWAFEPPADPLNDKAILDMRFLNEEYAGKDGFVTAKDGDFILGNGQKERFWAVNGSHNLVRMSKEQMDYLAGRLAKLGFNMVRMHGPIYNRADGGLSAMDKKLFEQTCYFIETCKRQGIYTKLSFYFPLWVKFQKGDGFDSFESIDNKMPFALVYFDEQFQKVYRNWAREFFETKNPVTGGKMRDEAAIAMVELVNEDSFFFWTFTEKNIPADKWAILEKKFGAWLSKRYGSLDKAFAQWPLERQDRDNAAKGMAQVLPVWNLTKDGALSGSEDKRKRMRDQLQFLTELQRNFYEDTKAWMHEELKVKSLISAGNWHTADPKTLDALERYTYTATDVIDKHGYFSPHWKKRQRNWTVTHGDVLEPNCALKIPQHIPTTFIEYEGFPHIITETAWTTINRFQADESFLWSSYGAAQGMDGVFYFALSGASWVEEARSLGVSSPACLGQAPAFALQFRRNYVSEADPVVRQVLDLEKLYNFEGSGAAVAQGMDDVRKVDMPKGGAVTGKGVSEIDPLACYVGRVVRRFGKDQSANLSTDMSPYIDRTAKTIQSKNGELFWHYGIGYATCNTKKSQGMTGFLNKAGEITLDDVTISSNNEYGTIQVIALDDKPLSRSKKILVQMFTEQKMYGFKQDKDNRIVDFGTAPINVKENLAQIEFKRAIKTAHVLDEHGYLRKTLAVNGVSFEMPKDSMYVVIER